MTERTSNSRRLWSAALALALLGGLCVISNYNYLLFHVLVELVAIAIAWGVFLIAWNARRFLANNYLLFLGIAYLFIGGMDLVHTLAYKGMGVFQGIGANEPTQLWIAARYMESSSLLIAPVFFRVRLRPGLAFLAFTLTFTLVIASIFFWPIFPNCFVEGMGLTPFKKISEYVICLILLGAVGLLLKERTQLEKGVLRLIIGSIGLTIGSELAFTFYVSVYGFSNQVGHVFKFLSFYLIYRAIIETGLTRPYDLLFRELTKEREALKASEARYHALFEHSPISLWENDFSSVKAFIEGLKAGGVDNVRAHLDAHPDAFRECVSLINVLDVNQATLELYDAQSKDELKNNLSDILCEWPCDTLKDLFVGVTEGRTALAAETRNRTLKGDVLHLLTKWAVVPSSNAVHLRVFLSFVDITQQKRVEETLRRSEETLAKAQEMAHLGSWEWDIGSDSVRWSDEEYRILGYSPHQVKPSYHLFLDAVHPEDRERVIDGRKKALAGGAPYDMEFRIVRPDSSIRVIHSMGEVHRDDAGNPTSMIGTGLDITDRKLADERQQELHNEIRHFAYIVSHDLRAPLVNIRGFSRELKAGLETVTAVLERCMPSLEPAEQETLRRCLNEDVHEALHFIESGVKRMDSLIAAMLKLSRLERTELAFEPVDMNDLVKETLDTLAHQIETRAITVNVGRLPHVTADKTAMEQIIGNLLSNAINYLDPQRPGHVEVSGLRLANETVFRVRDNGVGIAKSDLHAIFQVFQRVGTLDVPGEGMGLAHVRTLVRRHGGRIWCDSEPGNGSTFSFAISHHLAAEEKA